MARNAPIHAPRSPPPPLSGIGGGGRYARRPPARSTPPAFRGAARLRGGIVRSAAASMDAAHARGVGLLLELTLVEGGSSNQIASCQCPDCCAALPPPPLLTATLWLRLMRPEGRPKAGPRPCKPGTGLYAALQPRSVTQRAECIEGRQRRHSRAHRTCPRRASYRAQRGRGGPKAARRSCRQLMQPQAAPGAALHAREPHSTPQRAECREGRQRRYSGSGHHHPQQASRRAQRGRDGPKTVRRFGHLLVRATGRA